MFIQLIRHATLRFDYAGQQFLVDPMLSPKGSLPTTPGTPNPILNPTADLPDFIDLNSIIQPDAVLLTHSHPDHFDEAAINALDLDTPFLCQPTDYEMLQQRGFAKVQAIHTEHMQDGIRFIRTGGQHGTGEIGRRMGVVSGFVLQAENEPTFYIAGDTIWCEEVEETLTTYRPDVIVLFAGAARFLAGDPITMTKEDIAKVRRHAPHSQIVIAHMESWNHCLLSRQELREFLQNEQLQEGIHIPDNGEGMEFSVGS